MQLVLAYSVVTSIEMYIELGLGLRLRLGLGLGLLDAPQSPPKRVIGCWLLVASSCTYVL